MESKRFDDLVRGAFESATRRSVMRISLGALAASALTALGAPSEAEAKMGKKGKKRKKKKTPVVPATCPADLPVTCGNGCCPNAFSKCCLENFGQPQLGGMLARAAGDSTCNPPSFNCCSADQGGGSCGGRFPKCCPATTQQPFGTCTEANATCCPSSAGGNSCEADRPKCCPGGGPESPNRFSACCLESQACCVANTDCPGGQTCNGNCCGVAVLKAAPARNVTSPRAGFRAR